MCSLVSVAEPLKYPVELARLGLRDALLAQVHPERAWRRSVERDDVGGGEPHAHAPSRWSIASGRADGNIHRDWTGGKCIGASAVWFRIQINDLVGVEFLTDKRQKRPCAQMELDGEYTPTACSNSGCSD